MGKRNSANTDCQGCRLQIRYVHIFDPPTIHLFILVLFNARSNQDLKSEAASDDSCGLMSSNSTGAMQACKPIRNGPQTTSSVAIGRALGWRKSHRGFSTIMFSYHTFYNVCVGLNCLCHRTNLHALLWGVRSTY